MRMNQLCLSLVFFALKVSSFSTDWSDDFDYNTYIDEDHLFKLYWTDLENDIIEFGIEVSATGWIALGISPRGQMPNSDIAIGWVDDDGNAYLQDRYTTGSRSTPLYDSNQNLTLIEGEEVDGMTRLRWKRPKYTCDDDDMSLATGTTRLIWAFHATEDPDTECFEEGSITPHTNKGSQSINLDSGIPDEVELEDDIHTLDFTMGNVSIPSTDTTYHCKLLEIPYFNDTQHVVKLETIITPGNEGVVHHILGYDCPESIATQDHDVYDADCNDYEINMPSRACRRATILFAWAIGGEVEMYMPATAGFPISGSTNTHYVMIEMHYDNPLERSGIIDDSGFRMTLTPTLREQDVGIHIFGVAVSEFGQWIPPGLSYAHTSAFMTSECTENTIPEEGITVFGSILHMHTIGTALKYRHIRNGQELAPIDINLNYDFNYQQTIIHEDPFTVLPGDELILDCWADSSDRDYVTIGGERSAEEMCFVFTFYYPAIPMVGASTHKTPTAFETWMKDAQTAGYMNGTSADVDAIFADLDSTDFETLPIAFDSSLDGALEFYNRLWSAEYEEYNQQNVFCYGDVEAGSPLYNTDFVNLARDESFVAYDLGLDESCDNSISADDDDAGICGTATEQSKSEMRSIIFGWTFIIISLTLTLC